MSKTYKYSGLTKELYQRLVSEHAELRKTHKKGSYKQFFQEVKQCSELQARIIYQAFNSAVVERARISPQTVDRLEGGDRRLEKHPKNKHLFNLFNKIS